MISRLTDFEQLPLMLQAPHLMIALKLSKGKVYQLMHRADFPTQRFGRRMMVRKTDFIEWLEHNKNNCS